MDERTAVAARGTSQGPLASDKGSTRHVVRPREATCSEDAKEANRLVIDQTYHLDAPVSTVFRALTVPRELVRRFLAAAEMLPRRSSSYAFECKGGYRHMGTVRAFLRNLRVVLSWPTPGEVETKVTLTTLRAGRGTALRLRHTGFS